MPMREGVDLRHRKIRARQRREATNVFFRIKRRISDRRRKLTVRSIARILIIRRRRSVLGRRRR
jgi:hypothetical protein